MISKCHFQHTSKYENLDKREKFHDYDNDFIIVKNKSLGMLNAFTHTFDKFNTTFYKKSN